METKPVRTIPELAREACAVQDACNMSGVARAFVRALDDLRAQPDCAGNDWLHAHFVTRAWVDKLASLADVQFSATNALLAHVECARLAEEPRLSAHDAILRWARSNPRGFGIPCMRSGGPRALGFRVVDNNHFDAPILAEGDSWDAVLVALRALGAEISTVA